MAILQLPAGAGFTILFCVSHAAMRIQTARIAVIIRNRNGVFFMTCKLFDKMVTPLHMKEHVSWINNFGTNSQALLLM